MSLATLWKRYFPNREQPDGNNCPIGELTEISLFLTLAEKQDIGTLVPPVGNYIGAFELDWEENKETNREFVSLTEDYFVEEFTTESKGLTKDQKEIISLVR